MSPKSTEQFQEIRDFRQHEIIHAAMHVFAVKGLGETRLSDIASEAKISQGLIHHYFSSKEALVNAVVEHALEGGLMTTEAESNETQTPLSRLEALYTNICAGILKSPEHMLVLWQSIMSNSIDAETQTKVNQYGRKIFSNLVHLIESGQKSGQFIKGDASQFAMLFLSTIQGLIISRFTYVFFQDNAPTLPSAQTALRFLTSQ
jgi:AcrR family transcriptional regulator